MEFSALLNQGMISLNFQQIFDDLSMVSNPNSSRTYTTSISLQG
ncbi:hypothetical protein RintRC_1007 [Richelia intracellularis]|nr:hypothetical protein RintRC_1007 [Richelia intracellularis]